MFKETCVHDEGIKKRYLHKSRFFAVVGQSFAKAVADHMGMLPITTSTSDELFSRIDIDDFAIFGCSTHSKNELQRNGWR